MKIFGFEIKRTETNELETNSLADLHSTTYKELDTIISPENEDGAIEIASLHNSYQLGSFTQNSNETDLIKQYREMAGQPEVDQAIDEIVNEAIVLEDNFEVVRLNLDNLHYSDKIKDKIRDEFAEIIRLLKFNTDAYNIFRKWYIDGRIYYNIVIDFDNPKLGIQKLLPISPFHIKKVREIVKERNENNIEVIKDIREYYLYDDVSNFSNNALTIPLDSVVYVHSGLLDETNNIIISYLHKAIKAINQLRMMEDALIIYRLARAPERRVFYVDVGNLSKIKGEQYIKSLMIKFKNKMVYDAVTGKVKDSRNQLSMMEDFWIPRRSEGKTTEIQTLPGASNTDNSAEVNYFLNRMYSGLNIPTARFSTEAASTFSLGRQAEITRDELKFSKFIRRLQAQFSTLFYTLLRVQLLLKNIISIDDWDDIKDDIKFVYEKDNFYTDTKNSAILKDKLELLSSIDPFVGKYLSKEFVYKHILNMNEQEIEENEKQMKAEAKDSEKPESDEGELGGEFPEDDMGGEAPEESPEPTPEGEPTEAPETLPSSEPASTPLNKPTKKAKPPEESDEDLMLKSFS